MSFKVSVSKLLVAAGLLLITTAVVIEAVQYPWATLGGAAINETVLPDPSAPVIEYIDYRDIQDKFDAAVSLPVSLPDDASDIVFSDETPSPTKEFHEPLQSATPEPEPSPAQTPNPTAKYILLGTVKIPRLSVSENLFEGTEGQMRYGIGHVEGTALPGEAGNSAIAGHRALSNGMQPFRYLDKMQNGDLITITLGDEIFTYEVYDMFIVSMTDIWVLGLPEDETHILTLITCDPLVSAVRRVNRLIVRARLQM